MHAVPLVVRGRGGLPVGPRLLAAAALALLLSALPSQALAVHGVAVRGAAAYPLHVEVLVRPGRGEVVVRGAVVGPLARSSIVEAVYAAAWSLGLNPLGYDYEVVIRPSAPEAAYIEGTSLSLAVFAAAYLSLAGLEAPAADGVAVTGTVNPDLTVGFVAFVREKAEGLAARGYRVLVVPEGQTRVYRFVSVPRHMGPYAYIERELVVEPLRVEANITLVEAGWVFDALAALGAATGPARGGATWAGLLEAVRAVDPGSPVVAGLRAAVASDVDALARAALELAPRLPRGAADYVSRLAREALAYLNYSRRLGEAVGAAASLYALGEAYRRAVLAYLLALGYARDRGELEWAARVMAVKVRELARSLLEEAVGGGVALGRLLACARAASLFIDGVNGLGRVAGPLPPPLAPSAEELAMRAAEALYRLYMAAAFAALALSAPPRGASVNVTELYLLYKRYADHLVRYAEMLSLATRVPSGLVQAAQSKLLEASLALGLRGRYGVIAELAALDRLVEAVALASLYMALHPGIPEAYRARLDDALLSLRLFLDMVGPDPKLEALPELALLQEEDEARLMLAEDAVASAKLLVIARSAGGVGGPPGAGPGGRAQPAAQGPASPLEGGFSLAHPAPAALTVGALPPAALAVRAALSTLRSGRGPAHRHPERR